LACLKILFFYFVNCDVLAKNPVSRVKFLAENDEQMRVLSLDEQQKYLSAASQPLKDVAVLMLETEMRPEEIHRIRRENVRLAQGYLLIPDGKTEATRRRVPLTSSAAAILKVRIDSAKGAFIFPHEVDPEKPMIKVNNAHSGALKRSKIERCRLYDSRHTFASRMAMAGVDLVTLTALLGHSRIKMVTRYATRPKSINSRR
jgi:integrase